MFSLALSAQQWVKSSLNNQSNPQISQFHQMQKDFYEYWEPFNVQNGKYLNDKGELVKAAGWKQFKRWEWYMKSHSNLKTGEVRIDEKWLTRSSYTSESTSADQSQWTSLGPSNSRGGYAGVGRINTVAFHPTDLNTFWVGTPAGGLWKTTDNGQNWSALTDNLEAIGVSNVIIPSNYETSKTLYISTGDRNGFDTRSSGIYKSTDDGVTWNKTALSFAVATRSMVYHILLDPNNDQHLIASTTAGLKETKDGGSTWTDLGATGETIKYLEFQPGSNSVLFAVADTKFYKSTDGGVSWVEKLTMPGVNSRITVTSANSNYIYIVNANSELKKIYRSTDAGETFSEMLDGGTLNLLGYEADGSDLTAGQGWYDLTIEASPVDANIVFVGGINTWKTVDGGANWTLANHWVGNGGAQEVHADKHEIVFRSNGDMFEANDGGLYITSDGTNFINNSNGVINSQIYKVDASPSQIIIGLQDNGSKYNNGTAWLDVNGGDGMQCIIDPSNNQIQYSSSQNGSISRTNDAWVSTFVTVSDNIGDGKQKGAWVTPYFLDPNDASTLFVAYDEIWKSTDRGDSFTKISSFGVGLFLVEMAIAQSNSSYIYAYDGLFLYATKDGGATWVNSINNEITLPDTDLVTDIEIDHKDPEKIWVSFGNYDNQRVFQSNDAGKTWTDISQGLPPVPTLDLIQRDDYNGVQLYAGTDIGVYVKNDGNDWELFSNGLPNVMVTDFEIRYNKENANESKLIAVTYGRGTWISQVAPDNLPSDINLTASTIDENNEVGAVVAEFSTVGNPSETYTYSITNDDQAKEHFNTDGNRLVASKVFDFESNKVFNLTIKTCDSGERCYQELIAININDVNEAPTALDIDNLEITENNESKSLIGSFSVQDEDANDSYTLQFEGDNNDNGNFTIENDQLFSAISFDYEASTTQTVSVKVEDAAGLSLTKSFTITIINEIETKIDAPTTVNFENTPLDWMSEQTIEIVNSGETDLNLSINSTNQVFEISESNLSLSIGETKTITVKFKPTDVQTYEGNLALEDGAFNNTIVLVGNGAIITSADNGVITKQDVLVYPNPASEQLTIDLSPFGPVKPRIGFYDTDGKRLYYLAEPQQDEVVIDVSNMTDGMYLLRLDSEDQALIKKVLIKKQ